MSDHGHDHAPSHGDSHGGGGGEAKLEFRDLLGFPLIGKFLNKTILGAKSMRGFLEQAGTLIASFPEKALDSLGSLFNSMANFGGKLLKGGGGGGGHVAHAH